MEFQLELVAVSKTVFFLLFFSAKVKYRKF